MNNTTQTSTDVIASILSEHQEIKYLNFVSFGVYDLIQDRTSKIEITTLIEDALSIRSQFSLPFWDAFNVSIFNKSFQSYDFLNEVRFHNSKTEVHKIDRDFTLDFLKARNDLEYLTFNSTVILDSKERYHVPMLDFHIPISEINKKTCIAVLKELNFSGFLLNSGKSFHFYGRKLVSESELVTLLSTALLFAPIIDRAWIAHQLIERSCCLRISIKYGHLPFKVAEI